LKNIIGLTIIYIFLAGCSKDECDPFPNLDTYEVTDADSYSATISGKITPSTCNESITNQGFVISTMPEFPAVSNKRIEVSGTEISHTLNNLSPATIYYYRTYLTNNEGDFYGDVKNFTTSIGEVELGNINISRLKARSFAVNTNINSLGGGSVINKGVLMSTSSIFNEDDTIILPDVSSNGEIEVSLQELNPATLYYVKSFVENEIGVFYSGVREIQTLDGIVSVENFEFYNVSPTKAAFRVTLKDLGGRELSKWGYDLYEDGVLRTGEFIINPIQIGHSIGILSFGKSNVSLVNPLYTVRVFYVEEGYQEKIYFDSIQTSLAPNILLSTLKIDEIIEIGDEQSSTITYSYADGSSYTEYIVEPNRFVSMNLSLDSDVKNKYVKSVDYQIKKEGKDWGEINYSEILSKSYIPNLNYDHPNYPFNSGLNVHEKSSENMSFKFRNARTFETQFKYFFRIEVIDYDDNSHYSNEIEFTTHK
jgi:hypothetical protein